MNSVLKVLIADADDRVRGEVAEALTNLGYVSFQAKDGAEAWACLQHHPDLALVLLERDLPTVDAFTLIRKMREGECEIPAMVMSARAGREDVLSAVQAGASDYIAKPFHVGRLLLKISAMVDRFRDKIEHRIGPSGLGIEAFSHFVLLDISETGCAFKSTFPLEINSFVMLESSDVAERLGVEESESFPVRVANCVPSGKGWRIGAQFVGLAPEMAGKIRAACQSPKGFMSK